MAGRKHLIAANRSIKASGLDDKGLYATLIEFLRDCARELDAKGIDGVSARLVSAFQSAQINLARAAAQKPVAKQPEPKVDAAAPAAAGTPTPLHIVEESTLAKLRRKKDAVAG